MNFLNKFIIYILILLSFSIFNLSVFAVDKAVYPDAKSLQPISPNIQPKVFINTNNNSNSIPISDPNDNNLEDQNNNTDSEINECVDGNCDLITHNQCNYYFQCVAVIGEGEDECVNNLNCLPKHTECNLEHKCITVDGLGYDRCFDDNDCQLSQHYECNTEKQCIVVEGPGINQCQNSTNCLNLTHNRCNGLDQCVNISGAGANECYDESDCFKEHHRECSLSKQCVFVEGAGVDACDNDSLCNFSTSSECEDKKCIIKNYSGFNFCQSEQSCIISHNICNSLKQCIAIEGAGVDTCLNDKNCISHNECNSLKQCITVEGAGVDTCLNDKNCVVDLSEKCIDNVCIKVDLSASGCAGNCKLFYAECNALRQCVFVEGAGVDTCNASSICGLFTHTECIDKKCVVLNSPGISFCDKEKDCEDINDLKKNIISEDNETKENSDEISVEGSGALQFFDDAWQKITQDMYNSLFDNSNPENNKTRSKRNVIEAIIFPNESKLISLIIWVSIAIMGLVVYLYIRRKK